MKKFILTLGSLIVMSSLCFAQDAEIKNAQRLAEHGKTKGAISALQKAITTYPEAAQLYYYLGEAQLATGDQKAASASFNKGFEVNPKEPLNIAGQAQILILEKKAAEAKPLLDKALSMGKKHVDALQAIARAHMADKTTLKGALAILEKAKGINPDDAQTHMLLGDYYSMENNGGSAVSAYERAEELSPKSGAPWYQVAMIYHRAKQTSVSEDNLKKAVEVDPEYALAHKKLAEVYYLKKDGANAAKHHKIYLDLTDSPEKDDQFQYAFFLFMAKDYQNANATFKALSKQPDVTPQTLRFYAKSLTESGDLAEAQNVFEDYMKSRKDSLKSVDYLNYASLLLKQEKDSLWAVALEKSVSMDNSQTSIYESLVSYYFKKRHFAECADACKGLIKSRKQPNANDYFTLGRALVASKQYPKADSAFAKLIELKPNFLSAYSWAAKSKIAQDGDFNDKKSKYEWLAKPIYDKLIEIGEQNKEENKKELSEAYEYQAGYFMSKQEFHKAKEVLKKILEINPDDAKVKETLKELEQPSQPKHKKKPS
ncbi:MAG: tetratricopeptide repeat protein [Bacteroidetes bacterium]|nr:tetratricopeptide repeat protein [Bacteroidota bacterium]MBS1541830.1 tetratricopeptide repeat protein [Bacteroidota bacterium]